jgi:hypothetical protein
MESRGDLDKTKGRICLRVAEIDILCIDPLDCLSSVSNDQYTGFMSKEAQQAELTLTLKWMEHGRPTGELVFDSGGVWRLYRLGGIYEFIFQSPSLGPSPYKKAIIRDDFSSGEIQLNPDNFGARSSLHPLDYPLDELTVVNLLGRGKGVEIHGCGVVDHQGRGHLFVGPSGAGKTTMAMMWMEIKGANILSDDRIIVRQKDGFWIHGTPWHGEGNICRPGKAPLHSVYFLNKSDKTMLHTVSVQDASARLLSCSFIPFYEAEAVGFSLDFLTKLASSVPCFKLHFPVGGGVPGEILRLSAAPA